MGRSSISGPPEDINPLVADYDDADSSESLGDKSARLSVLSYQDPEDIDGGASKYTRRKRGRRANSWWTYLMMGVPRKRFASAALEDDRLRGVGIGEGLLADTRVHTRKIGRSGKFYRSCIFCGVSGSAVLAVLLALNLGLSIATYYWTSDFDPALQNWGTKGSGTEGLNWYPTDFTKDVLPIPCHSHNDYWRRVPLFSALRAGCTGTEADVWLHDSDLLVGHNRASLTRSRTFQSLYVNPIVRILEQQNPSSEFYNGTSNGVFDEDPSKALILLVDVKTSGVETWPWVLKQLQPLRERGWLTFVENGILHERQVTVVGTGNTPFDLLVKNETYRDAFFDAPLELMWEPLSTISSPEDDDISESKLPAPPPAHIDAGQGMTGITADSSFTSLNSYYASVAFGKTVGRPWRGTLTPRQIKIIRGHVRGAHRRGLKVRYWNLPSWPIGIRNHVWHVLVREGVDVLNVDDLRAVGKMPW